MGKQKKNVKTENGITLGSLIFTVIILIILTRVSVDLIINEDVIDKAEVATNNYEIEQIKERVELYALEYENLTGYSLSEQVKEKIVNLSIENQLESNRFMVVHDKYAIKNNKETSNAKLPEEYIFYNWNKATVDEIKKLEALTISAEHQYLNNGLICNKSNRAMVFDINGDGFLNSIDINCATDIIKKDVIDFYNNNVPYTVEKNIFYSGIMGIETDGLEEIYPALFAFMAYTYYGDSGEIDILRKSIQGNNSTAYKDILDGYEYYSRSLVV